METPFLNFFRVKANTSVATRSMKELSYFIFKIVTTSKFMNCGCFRTSYFS